MGLYWIPALGTKTYLRDLDHQYLSNIIWFNRVFNNWDSSDFWRMSREAIHLELETRFDNVLLLWKPLPVPKEINWIKAYCTIDYENNIIWRGEIIGSLSHLN